MRQRDQIKSTLGAPYSKPATDHAFQLFAVNELRDGQTAHRNYETRFQNLDLVIHPGRAIANFIRRRNTIATGWSFAGETSTDRCEINFRSNNRFIHSAKGFEPLKKRFARGVRKRSLQDRFPWARRLTDQHYVTHHCAARHGRRLHARATPALHELSDMAGEMELFL
jgi:hypothetical protein